MGGKGPHSAHVQIWDVTRSGFKYAVMEPHGWDAPHIVETINFVAAIPGVNTLTDGMTMEVGFVESAMTVGAPMWKVGEADVNTITNTWEDISFETEFTETPALLAGIQTMNNQDVSGGAVLRQPWVVPAVKKVKAKGFKLSMDRCEAAGGTVAAAETLGYIAVTPGVGQCKKTSCYDEKFAVQHALTSGKNMGWDDRESNLEVVSFQENFASNNVIAVASMNTRNGNNGGWMRVLSASKSSVTVVVDEDTSKDEERKHISEDVGLMAFSGAFVF
jgi:MSHA biogenesis protein MshQ